MSTGCISIRHCTGCVHVYVLIHGILHVQHVHDRTRVCERSMRMPIAMARMYVQLYGYAIISEHADVIHVVAYL